MVPICTSTGDGDGWVRKELAGSQLGLYCETLFQE